MPGKKSLFGGVGVRGGGGGVEVRMSSAASRWLFFPTKIVCARNSALPRLFQHSVCIEVRFSQINRCVCCTATPYTTLNL